LYLTKIKVFKKPSVWDLNKNTHMKLVAPWTGSNTATGVTRTQISGVSKCADEQARTVALMLHLVLPYSDRYLHELKNHTERRKLRALPLV